MTLSLGIMIDFIFNAYLVRYVDIITLGFICQMPFKSKKQQDFLKINHPEIYRKWKKKYGTKIKKVTKKKTVKKKK